MPCTGEWPVTSGEVFYYERGEKRRRVVVATEHIACTFLFGLLAFEQVMARRLVAQSAATPRVAAAYLASAVAMRVVTLLMPPVLPPVATTPA